MRAYSHQGHGPRADQTGRIHISDFRYPRTTLLRNAAGPYIGANSRLMHRSDGCLFDHLVSAGQNIWRDFETECLGGLRIHDKLEPRGLFDW